LTHNSPFTEITEQEIEENENQKRSPTYSAEIVEEVISDKKGKKRD